MSAQERKREADKLWENIKTNFLKLKRLRSENYSDTAISPPSPLQSKIEFMMNLELDCTANREKEVLVNNEKNDTHTTTKTSKRKATLVYNAHLSCLKNSENKQKINKNLNRKVYGGTKHGNRLLGSAMSLIPKAGYSGFATALPIAVAGVLEIAGLHVDDNIVHALLSKDVVKDLINEQAVDSVLLLRKSISRNPHVYLFCDKGNKQGNKNLAKYLAWYNIYKKQARKYLLDVNCTDKNASENVAAIHHSIKKIWPP